LLILILVLKSTCCNFTTMVINGFRNKRFGPGGSSQHLHQALKSFIKLKLNNQ